MGLLTVHDDGDKSTVHFKAGRQKRRGQKVKAEVFLASKLDDETSEQNGTDLGVRVQNVHRSQPALILGQPSTIAIDVPVGAALGNEAADALKTGGRAHYLEEVPGAGAYFMKNTHLAGTCRPCAYFHKKVDGCRAGFDCTFCHFCPTTEVKERKREKRRSVADMQRANGTRTSNWWNKVVGGSGGK